MPDESSVSKLSDITSGTSRDYYAGEIKVSFTYTVELRDESEGQYGFLLPEDQIIPTSEEAWAGIRAALGEIVREDV